MSRLDSKVHGTLIKNKNGMEIPEDEFIVFRPSDNAIPLTLRYYLIVLKAQGASVEQIQAVERLIDRVDEWRLAHPERCKVADVDPGELSDAKVFTI
jgi:hypothetical protein